MKKLLLTCLAALSLALPLPASALCLFCWCTSSTTPVAFGAYDPLSSSPNDSEGGVHFTCGGLVGGFVTYNVTLAKGANSSTFNPRRMYNATAVSYLNYNIYTTSGRTTVWGNGTESTQTITGNVTILVLGGTSRDIVAYGRIPGSQSSAKPGNYLDTVVVTVTYN
jgi:spore coat protein U-like protein